MSGKIRRRGGGIGDADCTRHTKRGDAASVGAGRKVVLAGLLGEEFGMGTSADQVKFVFFDAANHEPVRFDMGLSTTLQNPT